MLAHSKCIDERDFADAALTPYLAEIAALEADHSGRGQSAPRHDTRSWQMAMTLRAARTLLTGTERTVVAAIGDGDGPLQFQLARAGDVVVAVDTYLERTLVADDTPAGMLVRPQAFAPFAAMRGDVMAMHGDPRALPLPSGFVDFAYCHGRFNTLRSEAAMTTATQELTRILRPGGVACIALDVMLDAPAGRSWQYGDWMLPTMAAVEDKIIGPSGLTVVEDGRGTPMSAETFAGRSIIDTLAGPAESLRRFRARRDTPPNLVMFHDGALFCSLHLVLRKDQAATHARRAASPFDAEIDARLKAVEQRLVQVTRAAPLPVPISFPLDAEEELETIRRSMSWRLTAPLRRLEAALRRSSLAMGLAAGLRRAIRVVRQR